MKNKFSFYVLYKNFNNGNIEKYDVMPIIYDKIYTDKGKISKDFYTLNSEYKKIPINTKELLYNFIKSEFRYHFWSKCEWEFVAIDWPWTDKCNEGENIINKNRPVKIDVYDQLEPNIGVITEFVWEEIKDKL